MKVRPALLLIVLAAVASPRAARAAEGSVRDALIVSAVKDSKVFRTELKDDDIVVVSSAGAVILSGTVFGEYHRTLAEDTAAAVPGVESVENRLEAGSPDPVVDSDAWIAERVRTAFLLHGGAAADDAKIEVADGVVTLTGETVGERDKALATADASGVEGVKRVVNRMKVAGTGISVMSTALERMDDASVTARVKLALIFHRAPGARKTKVRTKDGVVTLSGGVRTEDDKDKLEKLVSAVDGVAGVDNRLTTEL